MISDYFPPHQRGRALSIYSQGIPNGLAAGALFLFAKPVISIYIGVAESG